MTSSYTSNLGIEKPATGDQSGTWGDTVNVNMDIVDRAINGVGAISLSGTTHTLTTTDGTLSDGMYKVLVLGGSPSGTNTITISPNDQDKLYFVYNNSGQTAVFSQGSGANVTVANGDTKLIYADGAGAGAAVSDFTANLAMSSVNITGGTIDGTVIGGSSAAAGTFTTLSATGNTTLGDAAGDVTQNKGGFAAQGTGSPGSGSGVEINFGLVAGEGTVQAFDRDLSAWEQLRLRGNQVAFDISGTEKVRINSSGNLGVGTSSPSYPLHVSPGTSGEVARFNSTASVGATTDVVTFSDTNNFGLTLEGRSGGSAFKMNGTQTLALGQVSNGDAITINGSGNVSVGGAAYNPPTTDNDLSFDQSATNNFTCTPTGTGTLTFTNHTAGQSGNILLINSGGHAISLAATTKGDANLATTISTAGTYWLSYYDDGTNAYVTTSAAFA